MFEQAKKQGLSFTSDFFIYIIDKFFSKEKNYVCIEFDDEYKKYIDEEKKELDELE
jgi:hypothetical protein